MAEEPDKYKNGMFKVYSGANPLGEQEKQINEDRVRANCAKRDGLRWTQEELVSVLLTMPPKTNQELAMGLGRSPGAINNIKKYVRNILIQQNKFGYKDGGRDSRQATFWLVYDILESWGAFQWPDEQKKELARYLPGKQNDYSKTARHLARNT